MRRRDRWAAAGLSIKDKEGWEGGKARVRPGTSQHGAGARAARQPALCLPRELRENGFQARTSGGFTWWASHGTGTSPISGGIRRCWVGERCTGCQRLGPRALGSTCRKEGRGGMLPSGEQGMSLSPLPPGSPCSSPEVTPQTADSDLQDTEEVGITRDTQLGGGAACLLRQPWEPPAGCSLAPLSERARPSCLGLGLGLSLASEPSYPFWFTHRRWVGGGLTVTVTEATAGPCGSVDQA